MGAGLAKKQLCLTNKLFPYCENHLQEIQGPFYHISLSWPDKILRWGTTEKGYHGTQRDTHILSTKGKEKSKIRLGLYPSVVVSSFGVVQTPHWSHHCNYIYIYKNHMTIVNEMSFIFHSSWEHHKEGNYMTNWVIQYFMRLIFNSESTEYDCIIYAKCLYDTQNEDSIYNSW